MSESETPQIALDESLNCPLCGYDLRGLTSPRCPECGHEYDAHAIRAAKQIGLGWLVESEQHHPWRAGIRTSIRSLLPLSRVGFWKRFPPSAPVVAKRLRQFVIGWLVIQFVCGIASLIVYGIIRYNIATAPVGTTWYNQMPASTPAYRTWGFRNYTFYDAVGGISGAMTFLNVEFLILFLPLATFAYLNVFGITFRRAGIGRGHLWRVAIYPLPLMVVVTILIRSIRPGFTGKFLGVDGPETYLALFAITLLHSVGAHVDYLRIRHAWIQAILVWVLCWLTYMAGMSLLFSP